MLNLPDKQGHFGEYGGRWVAETLMPALLELEQAYKEARRDPKFRAELESYSREYVGRPTPLYFAANLTARLGGAKVYLKREDLCHTGAHKVNNTLGQALLKLVRKSPVPTYAFWALTRLGARVLFYGPLNAVVHPQVVQSWLDQLFTFEPGNESERLGWAFCLAQIARRSGQRVLDVEEKHSQQVLSILNGMSVPESWKKMVAEVIELEGEEQSRMFGESLPIGLRLAKEE